MEKEASKSLSRFQTQTYADLGICLMAVMWGTSTVIAKVVLADLPPFIFQALRFWLAFLTLGIVSFRHFRRAGKQEWKAGILTGLAIFAAYSLQLVGLVYTSVANAAFIASLGVVIIPFLNAILIRKFPSKTVLASVSLCILGLYLLTGWQGGFNLGDFLCLLCALAYSVYTLLIDRMAKELNGLSVSVIQLFTVAVGSSVLSAFGESFTMSQVYASWAAVVFVGILATALVTPLQVIGQKYTTPTRVGIILLLEPVAAAILAFLFLHETLSTAGFAGCLLILGGLLLAELKHV